MSGTIPGGRQRTVSEGDILDYDNETILPNDHGISTDDITVTLTSAFNTLPKGQGLTQSDTDHDSNASVTLERKSKGKLQPFKSVRKSVARMLRQAVWSVSSSGQNEKQDGKSRYNIKAIVTPTFGRKSKYAHKNNENLNNNEQNQMNNTRTLPLKQEIHKWPGDITPGTIGLKNHGNTCFMNAVLQCLSNTDLLAEYFVTERFKDDLLKATVKNTKKYGCNGEITKQLATVLQSLWTQRYTGGVSEKFKSAIGKCNNQYQGSSQHDAQEFLLWLLDKLHEDLSSVLSKKNPKPIKSPSPCPDDDPLSDTLPQNKSFVYNVFQARHRSSLTCPNCQLNSNTFDPYVCVSLPLPQKSLRPVFVTMVMLNSQPKQVKIALSLDAFGMVADLRQRICGDTNIPETQLLIVQYYDDGWRQTYTDEQPLSDIPENETVYAIEMQEPPPPTEYTSSHIQIVLVNVERINNPSRCVPFCSPEVISTPRDVTFADLQSQIIQQLGDSINQTTVAEIAKDEALFQLRMVDGLPSKCYLSSDVDMPLYTETVDEALLRVDDRLPPHLKIVVEWTRSNRQKYIKDDGDPVKEHSSVHQMRQTNTTHTAISLDECFDLYTKEEKLSGNDAWLCPYCKKQQLGTIKKLGLWSLPDIFVIHLKRFRQIGMRRNKLNTLVSFPVSSLDMSRHVIHNNNNKPGFTSHESHESPSHHRYDNDVYDLYAVCNHYGNMHGGHYTAFCKNPVDRKWYSYDDSNVRTMNDNKVTSGSAYILFYQRRSLAKNSQNSVDSGTHWVYNISKTSFPELPEPDRANKPLPPSPKKSPSRSPAAPRSSPARNSERVDLNQVFSPPRGRQIGTSTLPRRREQSAPAHSNRTPLNAMGTGNTRVNDSPPRLRRSGSDRRSDRSLSRTSWARNSGEFKHVKNDVKSDTRSLKSDYSDGKNTEGKSVFYVENNYTDEKNCGNVNKVTEQGRERVTFETTPIDIDSVTDNRKSLQISTDCAENLSVNLPPPNQKSDCPPKSILKTSAKFDTLPRHKPVVPEKYLKITESKSAHELSRMSQNTTPNKQTTKAGCDQISPKPTAKITSENANLSRTLPASPEQKIVTNKPPIKPNTAQSNKPNSRTNNDQKSPHKPTTKSSDQTTQNPKQSSQLSPISNEKKPASKLSPIERKPPSNSHAHKTDGKLNESVSSTQFHPKDRTVFAIRHPSNTNHNHSPPSSVGSDSYVSTRTSSSSDQYVSPRNSYTSSPKSPEIPVVNQKISDNKNTINSRIPDNRNAQNFRVADNQNSRMSADEKVVRSLFPPEPLPQSQRVSRGVLIPGTAYHFQRPHPIARQYNPPLVNGGLTLAKPNPAPAPPTFNPFTKPPKAANRLSADAASLDRASRTSVEISGGYYTRPPIGRPVYTEDKSCLKESSV